MKSRILFVFGGLMVLWGVLLLRAGFLQVIPNPRLQSLHERQFQTMVTLQPRRGAIVDRRGRDLALSTSAYSLYADPRLLQHKKTLAKRLAKDLGVSFESIYGKIRDSEKRFVWVARQIDRERAERIKAFGLRGLGFVEEYKRVYPNETLLAQTLGLVGSEGQGLEGLELAYDSVLRGNKKKISVQRDARGRPLLVEGMMFSENPDGAEVKLTIDSDLQHTLEAELKNAVIDFEADQAFGVILDAQSSALRALASFPTVDANFAARSPADVRRNRVITDVFEPGSTMKTFAIAAALREKILAPNTKYNTENGVMKIGNRIIREAEMDHRWSHLTVSEILAFSSNIGTTKIAFQLGAEKLRQGLADFGFGSRLGVDLPGEAKGSLQPLPWNMHLHSNISFGQGISITPLQMANAYAVIANGGVLNIPYIVQSYHDPETGELKEAKPNSLRRVLSNEDAASMRLMLTGVTAPGGTGINAKVDGFIVAGKTGTAQKVNPNGRGYLPGAYVSSFAGFIPANDPKFVIFIAVDHPKKKNAYYGSQVAAPVFSRVASYAARSEGLAPVLLSEKNMVSVPQASATVTSTKEVSRLPSSMTASEILQETVSENFSHLPDLRGLTAREVVRRLKGNDLQVRFLGQGVVSSTEPAAGQPVSGDQKITVYLK